MFAISVPFLKAVLNSLFDLSTFYNHLAFLIPFYSNGLNSTQLSKYRRSQTLFMSFLLCFSCNINTTKKN